MRHIMAIYDVDPFYAARFADVVNQKEKIPFEVLAFSSFDKLKKFMEENPVELLLISSAVSHEEAEGLGAGKVICLSDGETLQADMEYPSIYKYQSSGSIIREVMACYCEREPELLPGSALRAASNIMGIFSPVGRCLKTSLAITMGQLLAQEGRTLYLNLEECSGLSVLTRTDYKEDLSDLLYFYSHGNYNLLRLNSVVHSIEALDYIPPVRYPEDLAQADADQLIGLVETIAKEGSYQNLILDIGSYGKFALGLMRICSIVYMPVKEDSVSLAKLEAFENYLALSGNTAIQGKTKKLKLPYHSSFGRRDNYLEQLLWGELGDYVRQLLRGGRG